MLNNTELDNLFNTILQEPDTAKRQKAIQQAMEILANSYVALNIAYDNDIVAISKNVGQFPRVPGWAGLGISYEAATRATR